MAADIQSVADAIDPARGEVSETDQQVWLSLYRVLGQGYRSPRRNLRRLQRRLKRRSRRGFRSGRASIATTRAASWFLRSALSVRPTRSRSCLGSTRLGIEGAEKFQVPPRASGSRNCLCLKLHADPPGPGRAAAASRTQHRSQARHWFLEPLDDLKRRGLAGTVGARQLEYLPRPTSKQRPSTALNGRPSGP
jgi:hypothetical protein